MKIWQQAATLGLNKEKWLGLSEARNPEKWLGPWFSKEGKLAASTSWKKSPVELDSLLWGWMLPASGVRWNTRKERRWKLELTALLGGRVLAEWTEWSSSKQKKRCPNPLLLPVAFSLVSQQGKIKRAISKKKRNRICSLIPQHGKQNIEL